MHRKALVLALLLVSVLCCAETYSVIFNSGNGDSTSEAKDFTTIISSATDNCVTGTSLLSKIYRAKAGYGIKGGTGSVKGELTLNLDHTYAPTEIIVYAAAFANKNDTTASKGLTICGQDITWQAGRRTAITPYHISLSAGISSISIAAKEASNNRFYIQKIEFTCPDPAPTGAKLAFPYVFDLGSNALVDNEPAEESDFFTIEGRNISGNILLQVKSGAAFSCIPGTLPANGGDVNITFRTNSRNTYSDTLLITATGIDAQTITRKVVLKASAYIPTVHVDDVDSSCMQISVTPGAYYLPAENMTDSALKSTLSDIINCGVRYRYGSGARHTWDGFFSTDRDTLSNQVLDMYSNVSRFFNPANPTASVAEFDIEHMFPKSWWGGDVNAAYQDLFHLVPGDYSANRSKSNHAPGFVTDTTFWNGSFATGYNADYPVTRVFCPADEYKGDFARAYFYIATCYEDFAWVETPESEPSLAMDNTSWKEFRPWLADVLLSWHRLDPVSEKETARAVAVNRIQGNRNPFIDYPELVELIWGNRQGEQAHFADMECSFEESNATSLHQEKAASPRTEKRLIDGRLYIVTPAGMYDVFGRLCK